MRQKREARFLVLKKMLSILSKELGRSIPSRLTFFDDNSTLLHKKLTLSKSAERLMLNSFGTKLRLSFFGEKSNCTEQTDAQVSRY